MASPSLKYELERDQASTLVDTRSGKQKLRAALMDPPVAGLAVAAPAVLALAFYSYIELLFLVSLLMFFVVRKVHEAEGLIMRLPKSSGLKDPKDVDLSTGKPGDAAGIIYLGNDQDTKEEIWLTDNQARTHMLFLGTTGSGKTEMLISTVYNSLVHGSGLVYVDGKADNSLYGKIYSMARAMGREDDVLVINFQTGARDIYGAQANKLSNTMNPFAVGSSGMLSELIKGLMATGKSDIWSERAASFVEALIKPLVYLRDNKGLMLDVGVVRDYFDLKLLEELAWSKYKDDRPMQESNVLDGLRAYLKSLAGYDDSNYHKQAETVHEQHGYITMQLTKSFGSLSDTYGYIMKTPLGEIDFVDVFLNRRILIVLLPALEKSPSELTNLGRIVVASLKATMAKGLGATLEGDWDKVIDSRPTTAPSPFKCVLDEYGYYAVEGFSVVPAQARSLGFSAIFAGQDLPAFEKASKEEAKSTLANTNTKFCGKLECTTTFDYFRSLAGQGLYTKIQRFEQDFGALMPKVTLDEGVSIDRIDRISASDLRGQKSGDWFMFFGNTIVRVKAFFANPKKVKKLRVNHFIKVARPSSEEIQAYMIGPHFFATAFEQEGGVKAWIDRINPMGDIAAIDTAAEIFKADRPILRAAKMLAYSTEEQVRMRESMGNLGIWDLAEDGPDEDIDLGLSRPIQEESPDDIVMQALRVSQPRGMVHTADDFGVGNAARTVVEQVPVHGRHEAGEDLPERLWSRKGDGHDFPVVPHQAELEQGASAGDAGESSRVGVDAGAELYAESEDEEFTIPAEEFESINDLSGGELARAAMLPQTDDAAHDHSNVFGYEPDSNFEIVTVEDDESEDEGGQGGLGEAIGGGLATGELGIEQAEVDAPVTEPVTAPGFAPPKSGDGLLDREAVETGLAQVEERLGSTSTEADYIGSVVASKLAEQTQYLRQPTKKKFDFKQFEQVARDVSSLIPEHD